MDLPHLNVLTKIDKISEYGPLPFNLDYYVEVQDLSYLLPHLASEDSRMQHPKFSGLNTAVIELIEDFGLVGFQTLAVENKRSMMTLLQAIDRAGGYVFGGAEGANDNIWQVAVRETTSGMTVGDVQERWIDRKEEMDAIELREAEDTINAQESRDRNSVEEEPSTIPPLNSGVKVVKKG